MSSDTREGRGIGKGRGLRGHGTGMHHWVITDGADRKEVLGGTGDYLDDFFKGEAFKDLLNITRAGGRQEWAMVI
jgi:hypothetical protein